MQAATVRISEKSASTRHTWIFNMKDIIVYRALSLNTINFFPIENSYVTVPFQHSALSLSREMYCY